MRGKDQQQGAMYSYLSPEQRVAQNHPLRAIREIVDAVLKELSPAFARLYAANGRPSIAPEKLLRALLLQVLYTVRSERLLMEQLDYNLLFRWFVGLNMDEAVWVPTVFSKNRDRLLEGDIAAAFFDGVVEKIRSHGLLSDEHFTVDGTLLEAWAGAKSFKRKDGQSEPPEEGGSNLTVDFHGEKRSNETHASTTDPDALLAKKGKGKEAKLSYTGHVLMENRNGLIVKTRLTKATGTAECAAALEMAEEVSSEQRVTLGGDKSYDQKKLVEALRRENVTPHVARNEKRPGGSAIDGRTARHAGYEISQRAQTRGRDFRLDEDDWVIEKAAASRGSASGVDVHVHRGGLQPGACEEPAGASGGVGRGVSGDTRNAARNGKRTSKTRNASKKYR